MTVAAVVYGAVTLGIWLVNGALWATDCDRDHRIEDARRFVRAPLWPLYVLSVLKEIVSDAKEADK